MESTGLFLWRPRGVVKAVQLVKGQGCQGLPGIMKARQGTPMPSIFTMHTLSEVRACPFSLLLLCFPLSGPPFLHMVCSTGGEIKALEIGVRITRCKLVFLLVGMKSCESSMAPPVVYFCQFCIRLFLSRFTYL